MEVAEALDPKIIAGVSLANEKVRTGPAPMTPLALRALEALVPGPEDGLEPRSLRLLPAEIAACREVAELYGQALQDLNDAEIAHGGAAKQAHLVSRYQAALQRHAADSYISGNVPTPESIKAHADLEQAKAAEAALPGLADRVANARNRMHDCRAATARTLQEIREAQRLRIIASYEDGARAIQQSIAALRALADRPVPGENWASHLHMAVIPDLRIPALRDKPSAPAAELWGKLSHVGANHPVVDALTTAFAGWQRQDQVEALAGMR